MRPAATAMTSTAGPNPLEIAALVKLVHQDRPGEAEQRARALLALHPGAGILWKVLSVTLVRQDKDALEALRRAADLLPQDAEAQRNLGAALHDRAQWPEALASLRKGLEIEPNDVQSLVDAANALRALRRPSESVPLYERALALDPRSAEAHNNLGNAHLELRRHGPAIDCYRRALELKPADAQILCNLANALRALGRREEAIGHYRRALELDPANVDAFNSLGNVLRDLGERSEAFALYVRALELDPSRPESHCNLGTLLFELRRVEEAVQCYRSALQLRPSHAPAHLNLAVALRQQRRPAEAESTCRAALALDPNYADALSFLGELLADRGRFAEAEALFQRVIQIDPSYSFAYASIATHRKMTPDDRAWLERAESLLGTALPLAQEIGLRYALGKCFDDIARYDEAFAHYRCANELCKRQGRRYDRDKLSRRVETIIRTFDGRFVSRPAGGSDSQVPIFIIGMPRSGTSLAEQILASHPEVFGAGEVTFWNAAYDAYSRAPGGAGEVLIPGMADAYLKLLAASAGAASRVVDKMPANFLYAGLIHAAFPQARIIHMTRHPIDTCLSIYFQHFFNIGAYANDLDDLAHYFGEYRRITDHWRAALPPSSLLEVPYEALLDDQESWTRRMLDFAGLAWDARCLDFHQTDRVVITASKWQVRQKMHKASVGRWRNYEKFLGPLRPLADPRFEDGRAARARSARGLPVE